MREKYSSWYSLTMGFPRRAQERQSILRRGSPSAVLAGPDELERVADHGGEGDAARLVAAAHRQGQRVERVVARVGEDHLLRQPDGLRPDEAEPVGSRDADTGQDVAAAPPRVEVDADAGGAGSLDLEGTLGRLDGEDGRVGKRPCPDERERTRGAAVA